MGQDKSYDRVDIEDMRATQGSFEVTSAVNDKVRGIEERPWEVVKAETLPTSTNPTMDGFDVDIGVYDVMILVGTNTETGGSPDTLQLRVNKDSNNEYHYWERVDGKTTNATEWNIAQMSTNFSTVGARISSLGSTRRWEIEVSGRLDRIDDLTQFLGHEGTGDITSVELLTSNGNVLGSASIAVLRTPRVL